MNITHPKQELIKVELGISRTNAVSQWNPVYKAFRRIYRCGNENDSSSVMST